jgi:hypothetical protein
MPCQAPAANRERAHEAEVLTLAFEVATPSSTQPKQSPHSPLREEEGVEKREKMV